MIRAAEELYCIPTWIPIHNTLDAPRAQLASARTSSAPMDPRGLFYTTTNSVPQHRTHKKDAGLHTSLKDTNPVDITEVHAVTQPTHDNKEANPKLSNECSLQKPGAARNIDTHNLKITDVSNHCQQHIYTLFLLPSYFLLPVELDRIPQGCQS